jgi:hypothetical protein
VVERAEMAERDRDLLEIKIEESKGMQE